MNYDESVSDVQAELLDNMPSAYSKIKGCWLWELMKSFAIKLCELLGLLSDTADKLNIENLQGDELDAYVSQWTDLTRKTAAYASGYLEVKGNGTIYAGTIVSNGSAQYTVDEDTEINGTANVSITAVSSGTDSNTDANTVTTMVTSNVNVSSITNPKAITGGVDEETDEALRERYYLRLQMPATSGNKSHYILWALECSGVGGAKATRDTSVNNKVNLYVCNDDGESADDSTVELVQNYIDPNVNGDGSGVAPIGAICEVFSAGIKYINIAGNVELDNTEEENTVIESIKTALSSYLSKISFSKTEVSYARLLSTALSVSGVNDISDFTVNGGYENIACEEYEVFTLGTYEMEVE